MVEKCLVLALHALHRERPGIASRLGSALGDRVVSMQVDREHVRVGVVHGRPSVIGSSHEPPSVEVALSRATLVDLVTGRRDLVSALRLDWIRVRGAAGDLAAADDALAAFIDGAMRVTAMAEQWNAFEEGGDDGN